MQFIYSPTEGRLCCFQVLAIKNKVPIQVSPTTQKQSVPMKPFVSQNGAKPRVSPAL